MNAFPSDRRRSKLPILIVLHAPHVSVQDHAPPILKVHKHHPIFLVLLVLQQRRRVLQRQLPRASTVEHDAADGEGAVFELFAEVCAGAEEDVCSGQERQGAGRRRGSVSEGAHGWGHDARAGWR